LRQLDFQNVTHPDSHRRFVESTIVLVLASVIGGAVGSAAAQAGSSTRGTSTNGRPAPSAESVTDRVIDRTVALLARIDVHVTAPITTYSGPTLNRGGSADAGRDGREDHPDQHEHAQL
jgi:hypothetical protein